MNSLLQHMGNASTRERQKPRDRQDSGLECPLVSLFVPGKAQPPAIQVSNPAQATTLYTKGNPSENYRRNYTNPWNQTWFFTFLVLCAAWMLGLLKSIWIIPKASQLRMQIGHKIHLNKLFEFIRTQIILFSLFLVLSFVEWKGISACPAI